jgi:hypothetical protein
MSTNLIKEINRLVGRVNYAPYNLKDTMVMVGTPQVPMIGLQYCWARYTAPRRRRIQCFTCKGVFVANLNTAGVMEIAILSGTVSNGHIQAAQLTGIPFPIVMVDGKSGGTSSAIGTACQLVATPEWRRAAFPGVTVYTFETTRLVISHGIRLQE